METRYGFPAFMDPWNEVSFLWMLLLEPGLAKILPKRIVRIRHARVFLSEIIGTEDGRK
jgi:hypothetical protein